MYIINKKYRKNYFAITISIIFLASFSYFILSADNYKVEKELLTVNAAFLEVKEDDPNGYIALDNITIIDESGDKFIYIVQPGDNLTKIAYNFGTSVDNLKKINNLKNSVLQPGDKLTISQDEGIIYEITKDTTLLAFCEKYKIDINNIKNLNYISDDDYELQKGDEIFIPISRTEAEKVGLIKTVITQSPTYTAPTTNYTYSKGSNIVAKRYYKPNITNGFYRGHCTRYVAIKKFPYLSANKQNKLWNGNAKYWYQNAKAAGFQVGTTAREGSIVVLKYGGTNYYYYGHVAIVLQVDRKNNKLLIEEMNALGRFVVTQRWIPMDAKVIGYIYY